MHLRVRNKKLHNEQHRVEAGIPGPWGVIDMVTRMYNSMYKINRQSIRVFNNLYNWNNSDLFMI